MIYLDNSATTRQYDAVTEKMVRCMKEDFGNPSSLYRLGLDAEKLVREARKNLAAALDCGRGIVREEELYFTSGGTEADNTAIFGAAQARRRRGKKIITTKVEHPAVLEAFRKLEGLGWEAVLLDVDEQCMPDLDQLEAALDENTALISVMAVNNEVGTVLPIQGIAELKERYNKENRTGILFHVDAVQALGKMKLPLTGVDMLSVSGHKIHGPKGVGALYVRKGLTVEPLLVGGGQERQFRSGTENVPAVVGFGKAAEMACGVEGLAKRAAHLARLREYLVTGIREQIPDVKLNGPEETALSGEEGFCCPAVLNVSFLGTRGEVLLHTLEQDGICVSTGSACSSNKKGQSHVLSAMGLSNKEIEGAIRFSFSEFNTLEELDFVLDRLSTAVKRFRKLGSFR